VIEEAPSDTTQTTTVFSAWSNIRR
jgi:hypothetical protein